MTIKKLLKSGLVGILGAVIVLGCIDTHPAQGMESTSGNVTQREKISFDRTGGKLTVQGVKNPNTIKDSLVPLVNMAEIITDVWVEDSVFDDKTLGLLKDILINATKLKSLTVKSSQFQSVGARTRSDGDTLVNSFIEHGIFQVVAGRGEPNLKLDFSDNTITSVGAGELAGCIQAHNLKVANLCLANNYIGCYEISDHSPDPAGPASLIGLVGIAGIKNLDLSNNHIDSTGCSGVMESLAAYPLKNFKELNLSNNDIVLDDAFKKEIRNKTFHLASLDLSANKFTSKGLDLFVKFLGKNSFPNLTFVNLTGNKEDHDAPAKVKKNAVKRDVQQAHPGLDIRFD